MTDTLSGDSLRADKPKTGKSSFALEFGASRIVTAADGTYRPDTEGEWAAALGVHDQDGELADLVAWFPDRPGRWWLRYGEVVVLGARALAVARYFNDPTTLHGTPQSWALARGKGVCVLRWDVDLWELFDGIARVDCVPNLADRLRRSLRQWEPVLPAPARRVRHAA